MDRVRDCMEDLVSAIKESDAYQNFKDAEERVTSVPGLEEKIREYCWKNYELQTSDVEDMYECMEAFEDEYREFRKNPVVADYLESELRMCRMLQEINAKITNALELMI